MQKLLLSLKGGILFCFLPFLASGQSSLYEQSILDKFFPIFISELNSHLTPVLNAREKVILKTVKLVVDSSGVNNYTINSNSSTREITFSSNLIRLLMRYSIAQVIQADTIHFDRMRFGEFYLSVYGHLSPTIPPEDAAELSAPQREILWQICSSPYFQWFFKQKIQFLYLHELAHQVYDYAHQVSAIQKRRLSASKLKEALFKLELEADQFALDKLAKMDLMPQEYIGALDFLQLVREQKFPTSEELARRQVNFFSFLSFGFNCAKTPLDSLCQVLTKGQSDYTRLYKNLVYLHNENNRRTTLQSATRDSDVYALYNLGDFYLKGSTDLVKNIDLALECFLSGGALKYKSGSATFSKKEFDESREYCLVMAGKIYELNKRDLAAAKKCYEDAQLLSTLFPRDYYASIIKRISKT